MQAWLYTNNSIIILLDNINSIVELALLFRRQTGSQRTILYTELFDISMSDHLSLFQIVYRSCPFQQNVIDIQ